MNIIRLLGVALVTIFVAWPLCSRGQPPANNISDSSKNQTPKNTQALLTVVVLQDLMRASCGSEKTNQIYGAYFLNIQSNDFVYAKTVIINSKPRIELGAKNIIRKSGEVFDKLTGMPAIIFKIEVKSSSDSKAEVAGSFVSGPEGGEFYYYFFGKDSKDNWVIKQRKLIAVL